MGQKVNPHGARLALYLTGARAGTPIKKTLRIIS